MGAVGNTIESTSMESAWRRFRKFRDEALERYDSAFVQRPETRKEAFEQMKNTPKKNGKYVLAYRIKM